MEKEMSRKLKAAYPEDVMSEPCRESIKSMEDRVERAKVNLEAAVIVNNSHEINYELANQIVGAAYMTLRRAKQELKRRKAEK